MASECILNRAEESEKEILAESPYASSLGDKLAPTKSLRPWTSGAWMRFIGLATKETVTKRRLD
jgi:hypothetical protein